MTVKGTGTTVTVDEAVEADVVSICSTAPQSEYPEYRDFVLRKLRVSFGVPALLPGHFRNPFNILTEFESWFEFSKRKNFDGESSYDIISDMLTDDLTRAEHSRETNASFGPLFDAIAARVSARYSQQVLCERSMMVVGRTAAE